MLLNIDMLSSMENSVGRSLGNSVILSDLVHCTMIGKIVRISTQVFHPLKHEMYSRSF